MPHTNCIVLPPEGGRIDYDAWVYNLTDSDIYVDTWAYADVPGFGQYGPFHRYDNVRVRPWSSIGQNNLSKSVPAPAPAGEYTFVAYIGDFGSEVLDSSYFTFTKLGIPGGKELGWLAGGGWLVSERYALQREIVLPTVFGLSQNYPNPFNPATTFEYALPERSHVKLEIFNVLGQRVVTLLDETQEPGYKGLTWNAPNLASGVYFYRLTAGDFCETKRMMVLK